MKDNRYVAAWMAPESVEFLRQSGVTKTPHLTTFFDKGGRLADATPYPWVGPQTGRIAAVSEWITGKGRILVAEMTDCPWASLAYRHYWRQGYAPRASQPYRPHITLQKPATPGTAEHLQCLVGSYLVFDRHGFEE